MTSDTPQDKARREVLDRAVGRSLYTCQLLESQLKIVLALLNDKLTLQLDFHSLAAPDDRRTLGHLIRAIGQFDEVPPDAHDLLAHALDARNRIVHDFFIRNVDAFASDSVHREALSALNEDDGRLSACAMLVHSIYQRLCERLGIDDNRIVIRQFRVHQGATS